jgi:hypothetical protein
MNAAMRDHGAFTTKFLDVVNFATLTPLSLLILFELSFPSICFRISSLRNFELKSPANFSCHT